MQDKFETIEPKLLEKAKNAATKEALLSLAAEAGIALTEEEASMYFERMHASGEISDDELSAVSGGGCGSKNKTQYKVGDVVEVSDGCKYVLDAQMQMLCTAKTLTVIEVVKDGTYNMICPSGHRRQFTRKNMGKILN